MNKKISVGVATLLVATAMLSTFPACVSEWAQFEKEILQNEVRVTVRDGECFVRWSEVEGATGYNIYRGESRFGSFGKVNEKSLIKETRYKTDIAKYKYYKITAIVDGEEVEIGEPVSAFTKNSVIISQEDDMSAVQAYIDEMHDGLESGSTAQFCPTRFAMMFLPGEYPQIDVKTGYYTSVIGLGEVPTDVTVGSLYVSTNILSDNNSTHTFWRGVENITINSDTQWAVSQATSMRRVQINGNLALSHPSGWSSGGFLANSKVTGTVNPGTQQQWMSRNDDWGSWLNNGGSHNLVFSGCVGDTPASVWSSSAGRYTNLETTEKMAEKPFLVNDFNDYKVFVPDVLENSKGTTWQNGIQGEAGKFISLDEFYIADESLDDDKTLNAALEAGKHILFTPGHYRLESPLKIKNPNTVVLGIGYPSLEISDYNGQGAIIVSDVDGVRIADILIDAGEYSDNMIVVGDVANSTVSHADNPIVLSNIYIRIGGVENRHTETETAMVINANDTLGDNFWIWRADHSKGTAWEDTVNNNGSISYGNPIQTGIEVNGDNVKCYALMVEHTLGYQTYWKGENGLTVMYQSETPYRIPTQDHWMSHEGTKNGYASYKVDDAVNTHRAFGVGVYLVNWTGNHLDSAMEVPEKQGIEMTHLVITNFSASGGGSIANVINDHGGGVNASTDRRLVVKYPL